MNIKRCKPCGCTHTHTHTHTHRCFYKNCWKGGSLFITSFLNGAKEEVESIME